MILLATAAASLAVATLLPGTYTNEEQVYFAKEAGTPVPPWVGIRIAPQGKAYRLRSVDAFGVPGPDDQLMQVTESEKRVSITTGDCRRDYARGASGLAIVKEAGTCDKAAATTKITKAGLTMTMADGTRLEMQRARAFKCWASMPRRTKKPDGSDDWWFKAGLMLHDRGGRVTATTDEAVPQSITLRMRNVVWPTGNNAPSLVLYVHGADPDHAISYSWADPGAKLLGINLRTMQGSCTLADPAPP